MGEGEDVDGKSLAVWPIMAAAVGSVVVDDTPSP